MRTIVKTDAIYQTPSQRRRPAGHVETVEIWRPQGGGCYTLVGSAAVRVHYVRTRMPRRGVLGISTPIMENEARWVPTCIVHGKRFILGYAKVEGDPDMRFKLEDRIYLPTSVKLEQDCPCCGQARVAGAEGFNLQYWVEEEGE